MLRRDLGELELFSLLAIQHLGGEALGLAIRDEIRRRSGRRVSVGSGYATLARLADKGLIRFTVVPPEPRQGGRARRCAQLTPAGARAIRDSVSALRRMLGDLASDPGS
ncbi:MAG TPA: helix-turn-helix transcriptional regulator [Gemmatimonadaceae bacterium]|jgi:DNA-binding PadR family transcriptional regulator|nr:helix-turn-helix transcriptional regulator [Gemmatimonadaceae bacterium]